MNFQETIQKAAFLGMTCEAEDIIDHIVLRAAFLVSGLTGIVLAIVVGRTAGPWVGVIVGAGSYAVSLRICTLILFHNRSQR